jgi:cobalt-zinc-cadmium resistance protein CzcA
MIAKIIQFSVKNKFIIGLFVAVLVAAGVYSMQKLPIDAVPDITNNQVQIVTSSTSLAPQEVEQFITFPVEMAMANIPGVVETRSISRFGLSVVTVVFEENVPIMRARQFVNEQIDLAKAEIPEELGIPEMMPITTGLGEIYQYTLEVDSAYEGQYDPMELRTIQDWIVKRQLMGIDGIIEVSSFGGYLKQYEISVDPIKLQSHNVTVSDVFDALEKNNENSGGSYIEKGPNAYYIRTEGLVTSTSDIENIIVKKNGVVPVFVRNVAEVKFGHPPRFGGMTMDGKGEAVGGITLMLKGANSSEAIENVHERVAEVQKSLPPGVKIVPYLDRSVLVGKAISTVSKNLIEGGLIVIFVLILLLGNFRAGMIVASVIPLSLLFAFILMNLFGVSANLMSLGAIDFGIVVDGAVIVVEGVLHLMYTKHIGKKLSQVQMDDAIIKTSSSIIGSAAFGVLIIIVVFIPIMTLTGIEGKMFTPMAKTVSFAILGALILSITYVPMMSALVLKKNIKEHTTFADKIMNRMRKLYEPTLQRVLRIPYLIVGLSVSLLIGIVFIFNSLGAEFVPTLDEGDMAMQVTIEPGSSLTQMINTTTEAEKILKANFPEVKHVVSKIGTAEVPTDPMAVEDADVMILLKEKDEWVSASSRDELVELMKEKLKAVNWAQFDFTQPIQLRFNELISGSKTDVAIKLFGEDMGELALKGKEIAELVKNIQGAGDVKIEQTEGLPQLMVKFNREKLAHYQLDIVDLNKIIRTAYAGENAGIVYEGERRFDLTVRLDDRYRKNLELGKLFVNTPDGRLIPLSEVAKMEVKEGPMQVSRENANRRIAVGINVRNRDIASFIEEVQGILNEKVSLKPGYFIHYGGQFENLVAAKKRLAIAVPVALILIFILLFFAFKSFKYALLIYATVPLAAVGGVLALVIRDMPFSISAGVGFIALFGVAVLNGIVLISYFNRLKDEGMKNLKELVVKGSLVRLRPVIMTAAVASLGFLPMAISSSAGAEVQKPLATVVIGGLITATLLTLLVIPVIYYLSERKKFNGKKRVSAIALMLLTVPLANAQGLSEQMAIDSVLANNITLKNASLNVGQAELDKKATLSLGNTSATFQHGQMNTSLNDYYWSIDQSLGNPMLQISKRKEAIAAIDANEAELLLIQRALILETKSTWNEWILANQQVELFNEQLSMLETLLKKLSEKMVIGDISKVDFGLAEIYKSELQAKLSVASVRYHETESKLRLLGMFKGTLLPPENAELKVDDGIVLIPNDLSINALLIAEEAKINLANRGVRTAKSNYFPELSLGYFNQSMDHVKGFQGVQFGVSIPIFNRRNSSAVRKAKINLEIQSNNYEDKKNTLQVQLNNGLTKLQMYTAMYQAYSDNWMKQADLLLEASELELEAGTIDYYRYVQARSKVLEISINRLELINQLNQTYYEVEYYTTPINQ